MLLMARITREPVFGTELTGGGYQAYRYYQAYQLIAACECVPQGPRITQKQLTQPQTTLCFKKTGPLKLFIITLRK